MRFACVVLLAVTSVVAAPVPKAVKKKLPDYYPLIAGSKWEYAMGGTIVVIEAKDYLEKDGVRTAKLVTSHQGKSVAEETIRVDSTGISRTHFNDTMIDPPVILLKFGLTDEESWKTKSKVGGAVVEGTFTLKGVEAITVAAGKYDAVLVEGEADLAGTATTTKWWLAEGVGIVKLSYTIAGSESVPLELKKYTPGEAVKAK
jgi:hypothetical protein